MFKTIIADPPWHYRNRGTNGAAQKHYPTMKLHELESLPVRRCCQPDAVLLMWATMPQLPDALELLAAWGFRYCSAFPWIKVCDLERLKPTYGPGFWIRGNAELVLIGALAQAKPPRSPYLGLLSERFKHSRKPEHLYEYAESLGGPYLEMFARQQREGWVAVGNAIDGRDIHQSLHEWGARNINTLPLFQTKQETLL